MRAGKWVLASVAAAAVAVLSPVQGVLSAQGSTGIVISEFRFRGALGGNDEFVELFNAGTAPIDVSGWQLRASNNNVPAAVSTRATIPANTTINAGCYYLVANTSTSGGFSGGVTPNLTYTTGIADDGGIALTTTSTTTIIDQVGYGANGAFGEGTRLGAGPTTNVNRGIERRPGGTQGHVDTNNNANDFREITPGNPQNSNPSNCLTPGALKITASVSPGSVEQGQALTVFGMVFPGTVPPSTGIQVAGDLSNVGGPASALLLDDGVAPDAVANDNVFTTSVQVPAGNPIGARAITLTATDAQSRTASNTINATVIPPAVIYLPHDIQGAGAVSPIPAGTSVTVRGVVTARKFNGFYIQTEPGSEDVDTDTSEGLFVFVSGGAPAAAQVGRLVNVTGAVAEFVPAADPGSPSLTELSAVVAVTDLGSAALPDAVVLTSNEVSDQGTFDQLERFEGMLVVAPSLTSISGTGGNKNEANATSTSDGTFYAVLRGQARPFREPGVESGHAVLPCAIGPCNTPLFDGNPERLRVDSDALEGMSAVNVTAGTVFDNVAGPLDFGFRTYTILANAPLAPVGGMTVVPAAAAPSTQFTVASMNLERFYDAVNDAGSDAVLTPAAYDRRLAKASLMVRNVLNMPDILGVQEVENLGVLLTLAQRIDSDAAAAGQAAPQYTPFLFEGNDVGLIDVGFLVKQAGGRVSVSSVEQVGLNDTFTDPSDSSQDLINDRPPLVLRATVFGPSTTLPQNVTVIVNHLRSLIDVDADNATGQRVRAKRAAQAEFLADYVQGRQLNDPAEAIVSIGDYNAFSFNDGYVDTIGTVRGLPAPPDQVAVASTDRVSPDLVDAGDLTAAGERYSYVFNGNAQGLDHVLFSSNLLSQFAGLAHPRVNADFPEVLRGDASTASRLSDHDPVVAYFTFPPDVAPPVFSFTPDNQAVEATTPQGAAVTYESPTATDNLDPSVDVECAPASGSVFPLGNSGVTCSTHDVAGNSATTSFTITVADTTPPVLIVPGSITDEATSPSGKSVSFVATAADAVTPSPLVMCTPASGSTFAIGETLVSCVATDAAGNSSTQSFVVTIVVPIFGHMGGAGTVLGTNRRVWFTFDVRENLDYTEQGAIIVQVRDGLGRPDRYLSASIDDVHFTSDSNVTFSAVGVLNGVRGYRVEVTAADAGEPGRDHDSFAMTIYSPSGAVVESATGTLRDGNIQARR